MATYLLDRLDCGLIDLEICLVEAAITVFDGIIDNFDGLFFHVDNFCVVIGEQEFANLGALNFL